MVRHVETAPRMVPKADGDDKKDPVLGDSSTTLKQQETSPPPKTQSHNEVDEDETTSILGHLLDYLLPG